MSSPRRSRCPVANWGQLVLLRPRAMSRVILPIFSWLVERSFIYFRMASASPPDWFVTFGMAMGSGPLLTVRVTVLP